MYPTAPPQTLKNRLRVRAEGEGFALFGVAPAGPLGDDEQHLTAWLASGRAGALARWMADRPERRARPGLIVPGARSVVMLGMAYAQEPADPARVSGRPEGRVSRHAQGIDYHRVLGPRARRLAAWLDAEAGAAAGSSAAFVDSGPILERAFAVCAGLGFIGRNTCLIHPRHGSWFFLAAIVTPMALPPDAPLATAGCEDCSRCIGACPVGALGGGHALDARLCLACLTVETREPFAPGVAERLGSRLFGCDTCQEVCPYNATPLPCAEPELRPGAAPGTLDGATATLEAILALRTNGEFERQLGPSGMARARRRGLRRNAAAVAAHLGRGDLAEDASPLLAGAEDARAERSHVVTHEAPDKGATIQAVSKPLRPE